MAKLTKAEAVEQLDKLAASFDYDSEGVHARADDILLACVPKEVADAFRRAEDAVDGFWWS